MSPLVIVILVTASERDAPALQGLEQAVRDALGAETTVNVREVGTSPDDDDLVSVAAAERAAAVTRLHWADDGHREAALRIYFTRNETFYDRTLTFSPADVPGERGRAMGLVIAAIFPNPQRAAPPAPPPQLVARPPPARPVRGWGLELAAVAARAVGGAAGGLGGGAAVRWHLGPKLALRGGVRARVGEVNEASASSRLLAATAGPSFRFTDPAARLGLGFRVDAVLAHESLSHFSPDDVTPARQGFLLGGGDVLGEAEVKLSAGASLVFSLGTEIIFARTRVFIRSAQVAELPPLRIIAEAGVRISL